MPELGCGRCDKRHPADVISEIITIVRDAVPKHSSDTLIIAWNWSWAALDHEPNERIITALPRDVVLMADFERGDTRMILGKPRAIDEYSLSFPGPSRRFLGSLEAARTCGLQVMAKLQIGTTHELATVVSLPLIGSLLEKARAMRRLNVDGFLGCWNFGNMLSLNTRAFLEFLSDPGAEPRGERLRRFADARFPGCDSEKLVASWDLFETAMLNYPFSNLFLYKSPVNHALAYPLRPGPLVGDDIGASWQDEPRGDELESCLPPYTAEEVAAAFATITEIWKQGVDHMTTALQRCDRDIAPAELMNARICMHIFRSARNIFSVYLLRREWTPRHEEEYQRIVIDEAENLQGVLPLLCEDQRYGWHPEAQAYLYSARAISDKLGDLLDQTSCIK